MDLHYSKYFRAEKHSHLSSFTVLFWFWCSCDLEGGKDMARLFPLTQVKQGVPEEMECVMCFL